MSKRKEQEAFFSNEENYMGNIWGWRLSMIGLIVIVALTALIVYRHLTLDVPVGFDETENVATDSLQQDSLNTNLKE